MLSCMIRSLWQSGRLHGQRLAQHALASEAALLLHQQQQGGGSPSHGQHTLSPRVQHQPQPQAAQQQRRGLMGGISQPSPSSLNEIMKVEELMGKSPEEISDIWLAFHNVNDASKQRVGSVMTTQEYRDFRSRAMESPLFVLPLPKPGGGFLTLITQCQHPFILVSTLEEYRTQQANAPAHMTVTVYPELVESKGMALLRGDIVTDRTISLPEGRLVQELIRAFYVSEEDYQLVHSFNHAPAKFNFEDLLKKLGVMKEKHDGAADK